MNTQQLRSQLRRGNLLLGWKKESPAPRRAGFHSRPHADKAPSSSPSKKSTSSPAASIPLFAAAGEGHGMVIAPTGKGKTRNALIPHLLTWPGAAIVVDVKGELTQVTAERRRAMGQKVYVLDPFGITGAKSASFNPFDLLNVRGKHIDLEHLAMEMPGMLHGNESATLPDPFWDVRADGLLAGLAGATASVFPPRERHVVKMRETLMGDDADYALATLLDKKKDDMPSLARQQIASYLQTESRCRSGILATATQHFACTFGVENSLCSTSIDLAALRAGKPVTIYLAVPASRLHSHGNLLRYWVAALFSLLLSRDRRPQCETLFLIDEAAQLGQLEQLRTALTLMRGYGVRTFSFWQDIAQLKKLYPDWQTLTNNCGSIQVFGANNNLAAAALARLVGASTSAADILSLPADEQFVIENGRVIGLRKPDYLRDHAYRGLYQPNPLYEPAIDEDDVPDDPDLPGLVA